VPEEAADGSVSEQPAAEILFSSLLSELPQYLICLLKNLKLLEVLLEHLKKNILT
jgi:hypothetical protein